MNDTIIKNDFKKQSLIALFTLMFLGSLQAQKYEQNITLQASEILPAKLLTSDLYQIDNLVTNDGYINAYSIHSDFGDFTAYGLTLLKIRLNEIKAINELEKVKKSHLYMDAAANTVILPFKAVVVFAQKPVETIKGVPAGVGRMFKGFGRTAKSLFKKSKHNNGNKKNDTLSKAKRYAEKFMGVNRSQRKWAEKLSIDPYSSNQVLQKKLDEVAKVDAIANFSTGLLLPGVGAFSVIASTSNLAWKYSAEELRVQNFKHLQKQGVDKKLIDDFLNNEMFSPTLQTVIVTSLLAMDGVKDRSIVLEKAGWADSEEMAFFFTDTVRMLSEFHHSQTALTSLIGDSSIMGGMTDNNRSIYALPIDHLLWSEGFAEQFKGEENNNMTKNEFWLRGTASTKAIAELEKIGWVVQQNVKNKPAIKF